MPQVCVRLFACEARYTLEMFSQDLWILKGNSFWKVRNFFLSLRYMLFILNTCYTIRCKQCSLPVARSESILFEHTRRSEAFFFSSLKLFCQSWSSADKTKRFSIRRGALKIFNSQAISSKILEKYIQNLQTGVMNYNLLQS